MSQVLGYLSVFLGLRECSIKPPKPQGVFRDTQAGRGFGKAQIECQPTLAEVCPEGFG